MSCRLLLALLQSWVRLVACQANREAARKVRLCLYESLHLCVLATWVHQDGPDFWDWDMGCT